MAVPKTLDLFSWSDAQEALRERTPALTDREFAFDTYGPRGLLVRDPYATQILNGEKRWEIRGRGSQIRGTIVIIKSGTGHAFGTVDIVRVLGPLAIEDLTEAHQLPARERDEFRRAGLPYPRTYAYELDNPRWFTSPVRYDHPSGAVTWVRLPDLNLETVRYAPAPPLRHSEHGVG
jgi:hypothetical protein